jgi:hypothetical protein
MCLPVWDVGCFSCLSLLRREGAGAREISRLYDITLFRVCSNKAVYFIELHRIPRFIDMYIVY